MEAMPRPRPPYLSREVTRHRKPVWYVRRGGKRIRIKAEYGTPEFEAEYQAAIASHQPATGAHTTAGTLGWLIECFRGSAAWLARSQSTRAKWDGLLRQAIETAGNTPLPAITSMAIRAGLERRAQTPAQAQHFLNVMRALFRWALKMQLVKTDPTAGVQAPPRRRDAGIRPWTEEDVAAYEKCWPIGTTTGLVGCAAIYGVASWRCCAAWASACPRWHCDHQDGKDRDDRNDPDLAGVGRDVGGRTMRRSFVHCWRSRPTIGKA
jgi:hypothetical protein